MSDRKLVLKEKRRGCGYGSLIALCLVAIVIIALLPRDRTPGGTSGLNPTPSSSAVPKATLEGTLTAKPAQTPEDKPEETYWPSEVTA